MENFVITSERTRKKGKSPQTENGGEKRSQVKGGKGVVERKKRKKKMKMGV
jgi:hypothetical protein